MALKYIGERTVGTLNGMKSGFVKDDLYRVYDAGILVPGGVAVEHGDFVSWDGTEWVKEASIKIATTDLVEDTAKTDSIAPDYGDLTFPVSENTYCMHDGYLYYCSVSGGIAASEPWTPAHWTGANVTSIIGDVETLLAAL